MKISEGDSRQVIETGIIDSPVPFDYSQDQSLNNDIKPVWFFQMFRYADWFDWILIILGLFSTISSGVGIAWYSEPYGELTQAMAPNADKNVIANQVRGAVYGFLKNAAVVFVSTWIMSNVWSISSERQAIKCRIQYLKAILRQEPMWHDKQRSTEVAEKMYNETKNLQNAIGGRVPAFLMSLSQVIGGFVIALTRGWKMALVMMSFIPLMFIARWAGAKMNNYSSDSANKVQNRLAGNSLEVLENIRTVKALGGEYYETTRYEKTLNNWKSSVGKCAILRVFISTIHFFCIIMNYTLGFWYGSILITNGQYNDNTKDVYTVSDVLVVFFTVYLGSLQLQQVPACLSSFDSGARSAAKIASTVDRVPLIVDGPEQVPHVQQITFDNVTFFYENPLFENFNIKIKRGRTAFVGESGSGKSTIVSLLMRFYDPLLGAVKFNDQSIKDFNLTGIRDAIGYVGQEPVLIGKTIREALIAEKKTDAEIIRALKAAQAWTFVKEIGLDSDFVQLSGGQKQRIAIARALIKSPQILILDEATSALDRRNEREIQSTIDSLDMSFVVIVAHKIETIAKADWIYVMNKGHVIQEGTYDTLMQDVNGNFYEMVKIQRALPQDMNQTEQVKPTPQVVKKNVTSEEEDLLQLSQAINTKQQEQKLSKGFKWQYMRVLFRMNGHYNIVLALGILLMCYIGCLFPLLGFYLTRMIVLLSSIKYSTPDERPQHINDAQWLSFTLLMLCVAAYFIAAIREILFNVVGNRLTGIVKRTLFSRLMRMSATFFDKYGSCSAYLNDCESASKMGCRVFWGISENSAAIISGLIIAFYSCWQITLIAFSVIPVLLLAGKIQNQFTNGYSLQTDEANKKCHQKVVDALINYKTVVSFNLQIRFQSYYEELLNEPRKVAIKRGNIVGLTFGLAQALISCIFAMIFYIGALLIRDKGLRVLDIYTAIYAIMFSMMTAGTQLGFINQLMESKTALNNVMSIIQNDELAEKYDVGAVQLLKGKIEFRNVSFNYPLRPVPVLKNLSFTAQIGQKVALVGSSGCGKSTCVSLLMRLYEPTQGIILLDDKPIKDFDLINLRLSFGVVTQEPVLFNRSVYENIKYNQSNMTFDDVVEATKKANAYKFISEGNFGVTEYIGEEDRQEFIEENDVIKDDNFLKKVGNKGSFLSGGQKQRVAIARAIARNPQIILLDEATSALDSKNEEEIQATLDTISGQTQIVVAHRLATIKNCDKILVFDRGSIVEEGTFHSLLAIRGHFYKLAMGQAEQK